MACIVSLADAIVVALVVAFVVVVAVAVADMLAAVVEQGTPAADSANAVVVSIVVTAVA